MTWWCYASDLPWSWSPRAYPGVWAFVAGLAVLGVSAVRLSGVRPTLRQRAAGWSGLVVLWAATDWPLGALGSGYLASAHMLQYFLYTFVAVPLLVLAVPEALARRALARGRLYRAYRSIARPLPAALVANAVLLATHAPLAVDTLKATQFGSFGIHVAWFIGAVCLWLPVCGPIPEARPSYPVRSVYLFLAAGMLPVIPGAFLVFAQYPLYQIYEIAPRVHGVDALVDQQLAGLLMKVGHHPVLYLVIGVMFRRWVALQDAPQPAGARQHAPAGGGGGGRPHGAG